ncbi:MAG: DUF3127 domain-containing protein [Muribaculaceae bacterium]|nr:DUF3127 domain-containing protein [Muribaculaceae bacterium]MDE5957671.1 DUF3127 domain-containing protein [Muribaculaceae bacterium]
MEITGRVILVLPEESGTSKAGNAWKKNGYVLETFDRFPKKVKVTVFGRNVDNVHMEAGKAYVISVDVESREFNGRWYTDVMCYAARETEVPGMGDAAAAVAAAGAPFGQPAATPFPPAGANPFAPQDPFAGGAGAAGGAAFSDGGNDDLPF